MYMYDESTTYSYSRCVEQCAAEYATQQCSCIDAYMPGNYNRSWHDWEWNYYTIGSVSRAYFVLLNHNRLTDIHIARGQK